MVRSCSQCSRGSGETMSPSLVRRQLVHLVTLTAVLVTACAPAAATSSTAPPPAPAASSPGNAAPAAAMTTVRVAIPAAIFEPLYPRAAKDAGLYAQDGLDVEFVEVPSDTTTLTGVISGEFQVGRVGAQWSSPRPRRAPTPSWLPRPTRPCPSSSRRRRASRAWRASTTNRSGRVCRAASWRT